MVALEVLVLAEAEQEEILVALQDQEPQTLVVVAEVEDKAEAAEALAVIVNLFQIPQLEVYLFLLKGTLLL